MIATIISHISEEEGYNYVPMEGRKCRENQNIKKGKVCSLGFNCECCTWQSNVTLAVKYKGLVHKVHIHYRNKLKVLVHREVSVQRSTEYRDFKTVAGLTWTYLC